MYLHQQNNLKKLYGKNNILIRNLKNGECFFENFGEKISGMLYDKLKYISSIFSLKIKINKPIATKKVSGNNII